MLLPEIAKYVRRSENTLRWLRHQGGPDAPPLWKQGRRLVAWKSELDDWLDEQRQADSKAGERACSDMEAVRVKDYVRHLVETAPPLKPEVIEQLRALLFSS
ncbi:helix-turn-helix domain-containing protein [Streptosporangium sp. NPDC020145]|uniref:helix-turn-helix transcriptional regulator n=1 Tax=Streptosporangium sp. NPDC020145 TaxID=3154694 RepID=UPI0034445D02